MTAPVDDPDSYPAVFDVWVAPPLDPFDPDAAALLPTNATDSLPDGYELVGQCDGATLYVGSGSLAKARNPHPVKWTGGEPVAPFGYGAHFSVIYQGVTPLGGQMRACLYDCVYTKSATTGAVKGNALPDEWNVRAYWYFEPPAEQQAAAA